MGERILFKKGEQRKFLDLVKVQLNASSLRSLLQFGFKTKYSVLKCYYSEKLLLPRDFFEDICHISKISSEKLDIKYLKDNWGQVIGGKKSIKMLMERYPHKIKEWRALGAKNSPVIGKKKAKKIQIPKLNEKLAEFIGVYLGDGTLNKYQLRIAGDYRYDLPYCHYLSNLVFELFGIKASIHKEKNVNTSLLLISSKNLCSFFNREMGLKYGNKIHNQSMIPKKIFQNERLSIACLRGLIDTDGSISRRGRNGTQFCIQFSSHNKLLLQQVYEIGKNLGIFTFKDKVGCGTNKWDCILKYFELVGSSNLKHVVRFYLRKYENKTIYLKDILDYFQQDLYCNLPLPFKIKGPVV